MRIIGFIAGIGGALALLIASLLGGSACDPNEWRWWRASSCSSVDIAP